MERADVQTSLATLAPSDIIALTRGVPPPESFPTAQFSACFAAIMQADPASVLQYGQQPGYTPLRTILAQAYGVSEAMVMISNGSQQLQDLLAAYLIRPGMTVLTEQPSYDYGLMTFRRRGARTIGIPLEDDGINIERLEAALRREVPAFLYLIPDFQNPTGVTTSLAKRQAIVELARRYDFWVIEDIPYRKLRYRGQDVPLLRDIDPQRVITMGSFSKVLSPALRVGYMIAPESLTTPVTKLGEYTYISPVLPTQAIVAEYLRRGWLDPNIERLKQLYMPRWQAMIEATQRYLPGMQARIPDGGYFLSLFLPEDVNTCNLVERARQQGLLLTPGQGFFAEPDQGTVTSGDRFVRLPFCAIPPEQIDEGIRRLASLL